jgi:type VI protein secretion system component VasK
MSEGKTAQEKAADVIEKAEKGKELTPAEQRAYDKAMADANEEKGYEPYTPGDMPGVTFYRVIESPSHTFQFEREAQTFVTHMRVTRNLSGL